MEQNILTPPDLAHRMVLLATKNIVLNYESKFLDPHARDGTIAKAIREKYPEKAVYCFESIELYRTRLQAMQGANLIGKDFLKSVTLDTNGILTGQYDIIVSNVLLPDNKDIDHVWYMHDCLKLNGRIVVITSMDWVKGKDKKHYVFRQWLDDVVAFKEELPKGTFKASGLKGGAMLMVIDKLKSVPIPMPISAAPVIETTEVNAPVTNSIPSIVRGNITITKAKLIKGINIYVDYSEQLNDGVNNHSQACTADAHNDLRQAFKQLSPHLASLCEQYEADGKLTKNIECRGFSIKGADENEGVVLTGYRTISNGHAVILNSPFTKFENTDAYPAMKSLLKDLAMCKVEVMAYLFENKKQPDPQMSLFPDEAKGNTEG